MTHLSHDSDEATGWGKNIVVCLGFVWKHLSFSTATLKIEGLFAHQGEPRFGVRIRPDTKPGLAETRISTSQALQAVPETKQNVQCWKSEPATVTADEGLAGNSAVPVCL